MSGRPTTRKRKVLSLEQHLDVCRLVERGEWLRKITESFRIGLSTVIAIYSSRRQLTDLCRTWILRVAVLHENGFKKRQVARLIQKYIHVVPPATIELDIDNFVASSRWIRNFKSRHDIRELKFHCEKLSADARVPQNLQGK
ncbi:Jerky protein [Trichinella nelsoni]|uniref:Jerky protein n=1 Tax=Trichinella nelsoni TaxID=6336 RepID=A0A0V0RPN6_9BILA|nr:Jerky protein [Trichinella nelsoni]